MSLFPSRSARANPFGTTGPFEKLKDGARSPLQILPYLWAAGKLFLILIPFPVQPERVAFSLRVGQSKPIYEAYRALRDGPDWGSLSEAQQRIVEAELREATLSGVALEGKEKERFNEIQQVGAAAPTGFTFICASLPFGFRLFLSQFYRLIEVLVGGAAKGSIAETRRYTEWPWRGGVDESQQVG